jgi:hypothetical protein
MRCSGQYVTQARKSKPRCTQRTLKCDTRSYWEIAPGYVLTGEQLANSPMYRQTEGTVTRETRNPFTITQLIQLTELGNGVAWAAVRL